MEGKFENIDIEFDAAANLVIALMKITVDDYKTGLLRRNTLKGQRLIKDCESFFESDYFDLCTLGLNIEGRQIVNDIRKQLRIPAKIYD